MFALTGKWCSLRQWCSLREWCFAYRRSGQTLHHCDHREQHHYAKHNIIAACRNITIVTRVQIHTEKRKISFLSSLYKKTTNFDRNLSFFIQAAGLVWNHALACMASPWAYGITEDAFFCGLIPYDCFAINSIPQRVADSIHGFAVIENARVQIHRLKSQNIFFIVSSQNKKAP